MEKETAFKSEMDVLIPPEIKNDEFYQIIQELAREESLRNVLEIGSSSGGGSTEAFVKGLQNNPGRPRLYCMEISRTRFGMLRDTYQNRDFVKCYNVSSVPLDKFPTEQDVAAFYSGVRTALNNYPLEMVLGWLRQDMEYVRDSGVPDDGIQRIRRENGIDCFDMVLIDGSEFAGSAELEEVYGARILILDDVNAYKNYYNYRRLKFDSGYVLLKENWSLRNGYAIFRRKISKELNSDNGSLFNGEKRVTGKKCKEMLCGTGSGMAGRKVLFSVGVGWLEKQFTTLTSPRFREYAQHHGFEYHEISEYEPLPHPAPHWIKVHYALKLLNQLEPGDLIAFLDADIAIVRGDIELTTTKSLAIGKDSAGIINSGVWAVRVDEFSIRLFETVWKNTESDNHPWQDNLAFIHAIEGFTDKEKERHVEILPNCLNVTLTENDVNDWPEFDGYKAFIADNMLNPCKDAIRFRHFAGGQPWFQKYFSKPVMYTAETTKNLPTAISSDLPIHFFTIVLNGEPFIRKHIEVFEKLPLPWHWHVIEGVAALKNDTAWSLANGGKIDDSLHGNGLSNDGTTEYLDDLASKYPDRVTIYRKAGGTFWDGKLEMVQAPLANIKEECLLWQVDADEIWTAQQIVTARDMFLHHPEKTAALYLCQFFVGPRLVTTTVNTYGNHLGNEWIRTWRFRSGDRWLAHEPPRIVRQMDGVLVDVAAINPFVHTETVEKGLVFHHYAYATEEQIRFKEVYYGYGGAVEQWRALQKVETFPVMLKDYFAWVRDETRVDRYEGDTVLDTVPNRILWIRTDAIGDNVLASGMLPHIRKRYPGAKITVLCQERVAQLYQAASCVDDVLTFDWWKAFHEESYRQEILAKVQMMQADLALNSVYSRETLNDFFSIGSFATERIALHGDESNIRGDLKNKNNTAYTRIIPTDGTQKPEMERHRDFLRGLGIDAPPLQPMVWTTAEDERFAEDFFARNCLDPVKTLALYPSGQWAGKFYERYPEALSDTLSENGLSVIAFGGGGERELNSRLVKELGVHGVNAAGETTIRQTASILRRCRIGIGADTGTAHIACAVGVPHVVLLWGGHFGRFFPYSPLTSVACLPLECYGCNWKCPHTRPHCVKDIHPSVVKTAFRDTLATQSERPRIFTQDYDSWRPGPGEPRWGLFNRYVDLRSVSIVPVHGGKV
jgi:ADP-heptose:LPS heptosyltransferase